MKVLELNRNFLILLGVCPASNSKWSIIFKINYILVLVLQILGLMSGIWFIVQFIRIDLNSVLYAGFHTSAYSSSTYSLLVGYMVQHKILLTFTKLQKIYDESNCFLIFNEKLLKRIKTNIFGFFFQIYSRILQTSWWKRIKEANGLLQMSWDFSLWAISLHQLCLLF